MVVHSLVDENHLVSDGMIMIMATRWFLELGGLSNHAPRAYYHSPFRHLRYHRQIRRHRPKNS
jgi:hypothetical protein